MTLISNEDDASVVISLLESMLNDILTSHYCTLWNVEENRVIAHSRDYSFLPKKGILFQCLQEHEAKIYNTLEFIDSYDKESDNDQNNDVKDMLLFPIVNAQKKCIGIVQAATKKGDLQQFTNSDLSVVTASSVFILKVMEKLLDEKGIKKSETGQKYVDQSTDLLNELKKRLNIAQAQVDSRTQFLAEIAHEIRTPLHAILGYMELMRLEERDKTKLKYLDNALKSGSSMGTLLNDLLDFTKIEKGEMQIEKISCSISEEIKSIVSIFYQKMLTSGIKFFAYIDPRLPKEMMTDPNRIRQILSNLLGNAIKFTPTDGSIVLEVTYDNNAILFNVIDTGIGIAKEKQDAIFEAYKQESSATARQYGGTGLGLSISMKLAKLLGSKLALESSVGKGSRFYFTLGVDSANETLTTEYNYNVLKELKPAVLLSKQHLFMLPYLEKYFEVFHTEKLQQFEDFKTLQSADYASLFISSDLVEDDALQILLNRSMPVYLFKKDGTKSYAKKYDGNIKDVEAYIDFIDVESYRVVDTLSQQTSLKGKTILTVDDNLINQQLMESILEKLGAKVLKASNGKKAVDVYKDVLKEKRHIDLIFMDENMPEMNGQDAVKEIFRYSKSEQIEDVIIIGLSGNATSAQKEGCIAVGMKDCLYKPVKIKDILSTVNKYLN